MTLHEVCRDFRHWAAFPFEQVHMGHELLPLQSVAGVDETIRVRIDVGIVDLGEIANQDHLAAFSHSRDECFCLVWSELLGFIDDEDGAGNGASADVSDGFHLDQTGLDERFVGATGFGSDSWIGRLSFLGVGGVGFSRALAFIFELLGFARFCEEVFECVVGGLQPRLHFFFDPPRQESDVFAGWHDDTGDEHLLVLSRLDLFEGRTYGEECFTCARFAVDGYEGDVWVIKGVEEESLAEVERLEGATAPDCDVVSDEGDEGAVFFVPSWDAVAGRVAVLDEEVLIRQEAFLFAGEMDESFAGEGLHSGSGQFEGFVFFVAVTTLGAPNIIVVLDAIRPVVLSIEAEGTCFELQV